jgi:hypothetical protein
MAFCCILTRTEHIESLRGPLSPFASFRPNTSILGRETLGAFTSATWRSGTVDRSEVRPYVVCTTKICTSYVFNGTSSSISNTFRHLLDCFSSRRMASYVELVTLSTLRLNFSFCASHSSLTFLRKATTTTLLVLNAVPDSH